MPRRRPQQAGRRRRPSGLSRWNRRDRLTIVVTYRGGAEAWVQLEARGRTWRVPGHLPIYDALTDVWDGVGGTPPE